MQSSIFTYFPVAQVGPVFFVHSRHNSFLTQLPLRLHFPLNWTEHSPMGPHCPLRHIRVVHVEPFPLTHSSQILCDTVNCLLFLQSSCVLLYQLNQFHCIYINCIVRGKSTFFFFFYIHWEKNLYWSITMWYVTVRRKI